MNLSIKIDNLLKHFVDTGPKGCGAVVMHHGEKIYEGYAGYADEENGIKVSDNTYFRYYSCTKVFTVISLMQLYEQGKFLLNDPIEKYLPEFSNPKVYEATANGVLSVRAAKRSVTIKDLLSMQSGLTYEGRANQTETDINDMSDRLRKTNGFTCREHVKELSKIPLLFDPGEGFYYGYSHDIIGALIEVLSGLSLSEYMRKNIFEPLKLNHICFFKEEINNGNIASLYTWDTDKKLIPTNDYDWQFTKSNKWESAGSGILASVHDVAKFASALAMGGTLNGIQIIGRKTIDLISTNQLSGKSKKDFMRTWDNGWEFLRGYGYGLGVRTLIEPEEGGVNSSIGEFGWGGMAGTYILADPKEEISISYAHQIVPNNMEGYCHPRLKQCVYSNLK